MKKIIAVVGGLAFASTLVWLWATSPDSSQTTPRSFGSAETSGHGSAESGTDTEVTQAPVTQGSSPRSASITPLDQQQDHDATASELNTLISVDTPDRPAQINLWQTSSGNASTTADGFPATQLQTDPAILNTLHVGQELIIDIPGLVQPVISRIEETHNQLDTVNVFSGPILNQGDHANLIITRGQNASYVIVSTNESVWSAVIDHQTGETLLTDERDILIGLSHEDTLPVPRVDLQPPDRSQLAN